MKLQVCKYSISIELYISLSILEETKGNSTLPKETRKKISEIEDIAMETLQHQVIKYTYNFIYLESTGERSQDKNIISKLMSKYFLNIT